MNASSTLHRLRRADARTRRVASIAALIAASGASAATEIRLGQVSLSFYAVTGEVVRAVLEENGHTVRTIEGSHAEIYPRLGAGEVDLLAASWLPNGHAELFAEVESSVERLTPLYDGARFFWVVTAGVPKSAVASVGDLAKPEVAERMPKRIPTLDPSTGLTVGAEHMVEAHGLDAAGYELVPGPAADWVGALEDAVAEESWIVLPLWQPQWLNAAYQLRRLDDPKNAYGPDDTAWLVAHEALADELDETTLAHLRAIRLPVPAVTEMDRLVNEDGLTPRAAAARWMGDHPEAVAGWRPD